MVRLREALARQFLVIFKIRSALASAEYVLTRLHHISISIFARGVYSTRELRLGTIHNTETVAKQLQQN